MKARKLVCTLGLTREEWLEWRRQGIGGSDAAAVLGLSAWDTPYTLYCNKKKLIPDKEDNESMRQGRDLEEYVAQRFVEYYKKLGETKVVCKHNYMLQHPDYPWMLADVDRLVRGENAVLECKTTSVLNKTAFDKGDIPAHYYTQAVHYLAVTGMDRCYIAVLVLNKGFHVFHIDRSDAEADIEALIQAEKDYWEGYIIPGVEPSPFGTEADAEAIRYRYGSDVDPDIVAPLFGMDDDIRRYLFIKDQIKLLEKEAAKYEQYFQTLIGNAACGESTEYTIKWPLCNRTSVDSKLLKKDYPDVYDKVCKTTQYRRMSVKKHSKED